MKAIQSIKAIQYRAYGAYAENRFVDLPAPAANDGQVLVRMHTVGINPLDNTFRSGEHLLNPGARRVTQVAIHSASAQANSDIANV